MPLKKQNKDALRFNSLIPDNGFNFVPVIDDDHTVLKEKPHCYQDTLKNLTGLLKRLM